MYYPTIHCSLSSRYSIRWERNNWTCDEKSIITTIAGRIHIPRIAFTIRVRGTGYYGSYPILNTQSVNTIFSIFNFPPTGGYQLHRLFTTTHASSTSYRSYLVFMKTSFACLAPSGSAPARRPFLTSFSYHSCHISHLLHR